jgi:hypothetical protein
MEMRSLLREIIPAMFQLAVAGKLKADTVTVKLEDLGMIAKMELKNGERIVIKM